VRQCETSATRRGLLKGIAGTGFLWTAGRSALGQETVSSTVTPMPPGGKIPRMKITKVEPILTGRDTYVRIETDAGIVGYGDATNHFVPYSVEGMLKDVIPYLIGEDPERIEYLWQACFRRRFMRGGPATTCPAT